MHIIIIIIIIIIINKYPNIFHTRIMLEVLGDDLKNNYKVVLIRFCGPILLNILTKLCRKIRNFQNLFLNIIDIAFDTLARSGLNGG